ncbi:hypothetical protein EV421DRAFT_1803181 [Armillaria borealis]|uniref:Uncharacterized protein n=1 Tax=Armillaria borealis TaxID=47425 RepID=A0AA39JJF0_9AGAR|nr:hypothetical protein EV421DRAFT_1803181 [Armillaria borealis]
MGLVQALRGFELDMLVLNPAWERETVPGALERLIENIKQSPDPDPDDRKAALYTDLPPPTTLTKSISQYLSRNRAQNDASNRAEFLRPTSCARTDAKTLDRDTQMKYDTAKNEDGPLLSSSGTLRYVSHYFLSDCFSQYLAVPSPPARIQFLEEHIIRLEKEYPPWAALHFNQPRRNARLFSQSPSCFSDCCI